MQYSTRLTLIALAMGLSTSCGKSVKKGDSKQGQASGEVTGTGGADSNAKQSTDSTGNSNGEPNPNGGGDPAEKPTPGNTGTDGTIPSGYPTVEEGGSLSGLTNTGKVYFADGDSVFFNFSASVSGGKTAVQAHLWFKEKAPSTPVKGQLRKGNCDLSNSPIYQHIAGDLGSTSVIEISFAGSSSPQFGSSTFNFVPREESLSFVVPVSEGIILCSAWPQSATTQPDSGSDSNNINLMPVESGGDSTGFLADGTVYFAPGDTVFYTAEIEIDATKTTLSSEVHFKAAAPANEIQGKLMEGQCSDESAKIYQHLAGNNAPGESELHVQLSGDGLKKSGTGVGNFVPRSTPLSYLIDLDEETRVCLDLGLIQDADQTIAVAASDGIPKEGNDIVKVVDGETSQVMADGTVMFGPNVSIFFNVQYTTTNGITTVVSSIHFKNGATTAPLQGFVHSGSCDVKDSSRYQHIAGNSTPGKSEIHVPMQGRVGDISLKGTGRGEFSFRNEPISYVIQIGEQRLCANFAKN